MRNHLLFQLYGPMASWGDVAVGEMRPTFNHPSKSAVLGLVAAALGLKRSDSKKQRALAGDYHFAVRLENAGVMLRDFHTAEVPSGKRLPAHVQTRRDELNAVKHSDNPVLSRRDYRCDARATICLWTADEDPRWSLSELAEELRAPSFLLYLGRKACPLSLPLHPKVVEAKSLREAFQQMPMDTFTQSLFDDKKPAEVRFYWEGEGSEGFAEAQLLDEVERRDQPMSRTRWQFARRTEKMASVSSDELTPEDKD
jgi:CRISPR system Cascade subunit CasD